jgi:hypothetical protein
VDASRAVTEARFLDGLYRRPSDAVIVFPTPKPDGDIITP